MKNSLLLFLLFVMLAGSFVSAEENPVYIDVRTWAEHRFDHIDGDTRIHVSDIVAGVTDKFPDKNTPIKLYCERGVRAETALGKLKASGYLNVENVGGIDQVREARFGSQSSD